MGEVNDLPGRAIPIEDDELIENLARFADGTLSEAAVKSRHHLTQRRLGGAGRERQARRACRGLQTSPDTQRRHQAGARANRDRGRAANSRRNHAGPQRQRTAQDRFNQNT